MLLQHKKRLEEAEKPTSLADKAADVVADLVGSWKFIIIQSILMAGWIVLNVIGMINHWDPYPFVLLNLVLSFQAAFTAPIIMMSQNRAADKDRLVAEIDHQVNVKSETQIGLLVQRLDNLEKSLMHRLDGKAR